MTNPFDLGGYEPQSMSGLFSKIKKAVKKVKKATKSSIKSTVKTVKTTAKNPLNPKATIKAVKSDLKTQIRSADTMVRAVHTALTPAAIEKLRKKISVEIRKSPIAMAAIMVAASFLIGPAVAALANQIGVASATMIKGATAIAKSVSNDLLKAAHVKAVTKDVMDKINKQVNKISKMNADLAKDADFVKTIKYMKDRNRSDADVLITWADSATARKTAEAQVAAMLLPDVIAKLKADKSVPSAQVDSIAKETVAKMASEIVMEARVKQVSPLVNAIKQEPLPTALPASKAAVTNAVTIQAPRQPEQNFIPLVAVAASLFI